MESVKMEIGNICRGCLSFDRDLKPLKENIDLFYYILGEHYVPGDSKKISLLLCWECTAILNRIVLYRKRFQRSRKLFLECWNEPLSINSLSCLNTFQKDYYDFTIEYNEDVCQKVELASDYIQNETDENEINVKEEGCENIFNYEIKCEPVEIQRNRSGKRRNVARVKNFKSSVVNYDRNNLDHYVRRVQLSFKEIESLSKAKQRKFMCVTPRAHMYFKNKVNMMRSDIGKKDSDDVIMCSLCKSVFTDTVSLKCHWEGHTFDALKCIHCDMTMTHKSEVFPHLTTTHKRIWICHCGFEFYSRKEYYYHYKRLHTEYKCDYCHKSFRRKEKIEKHMMSKHLPNKCELCHRVYTTASHLKQHYFIFHTELKMESTEMTYCVECDKHFVNSFLYKRHLRTAVAHRPKEKAKIPCPDCGKIFTRKTYMKNHYNLVHEQRSKYYCELCDKYFANGHSIRTHKKFVHDKIEKPRDKMCSICGRGFFTNRVLINHMRTHTGERPHECSYCDSAFAQDTARKAHERTQHKNIGKVENDL